MKELFKEIRLEDISTAEPAGLRSDLTKLKDYSNALLAEHPDPNQVASTEKLALAVVKSWRIGDEIKPDIIASLAKWLITPNNALRPSQGGDPLP